MRLVFWNCNMAFHRKVDALMRLKPDIAVISECADPDTLVKRGAPEFDDDTCTWIGTNRHKGLGVFSFNGFRVRRHERFHPTLKYILPVNVSGRAAFNLLGVWAQNASAGITRKKQLGPLRLALSRYLDFLTSGPSIVGGDFNNNAIWDRPGWRINHMTKVRLLSQLGLTTPTMNCAARRMGTRRPPRSIGPIEQRTARPITSTMYSFRAIALPRRSISRWGHLTIGAAMD
jgi:exodeoxyribonuclease-3